MKKLIRNISLVFTLIVLVIAGLVGYIFSLDPNDFRDDIAALAADQGIELSIDGDLAWQLYPELVLEVNQANVQQGDNGASIAKLNLQLRLWPLLQKRIEFRGLDIQGAHIVVAQPDGSQTPTPAVAAGPAVVPAIAFDLLRIVDSQLAYLPLGGEPIVVSGINLEAMRFNTAGAPFALTGSLNITGVVPQFPQPINFEAALSLGAEQIELDLQRLEAQVALPKQSLPLRFGANLVYKPADSSLAISSAQLDLAGMQVEWNLLGSVDAMSFEGFARTNRFSPATIMAAAGADLALDDALQSLELGLDFNMAGKQIGLSNVRVLLDESNLQGSAQIDLIDTPKLNFVGQIDQINLDKYFPPKEEAPVAVAPAAPAPMAELPAHQLTAQLAIGSLQTSGLQVTSITSRVQSNAGEIQLTELSGQLAGGTLWLTGRFGLGANPAQQLQFTATEIAIGQVLLATTGKSLVTGRLSATYNGSARGATSDAVLASLIGNGSVAADQLMLLGVDVEGMVCDISDRIQRQSLVSQYGALGNQTPLSDMKAFIATGNGIAQITGIDAAIGNIHATGNGRVNLPTREIRIDLQAKIQGEKTSEQGCTVNRYLRDRTLPMVCTGTLGAADFACGADTNFLTNALQSALTEGLTKQLLGDDVQLDPDKPPAQQLLEGMLRRAFP